MSPDPIYTPRCGSCGTKNRIPANRIGQTAKCGKCGSDIKTDDLVTEQPIIVGDHDFIDQVVKSPLPVLLDCWAPWCGPCKMVSPILDDLAREWKGKVRICKLNVDENPKTASQFGIRSIPTLLVFDNTKLKETLVGALPKQQIVQAVTPFI